MFFNFEPATGTRDVRALISTLVSENVFALNVTHILYDLLLLYEDIS